MYNLIMKYSVYSTPVHATVEIRTPAILLSRRYLDIEDILNPQRNRSISNATMSTYANIWDSKHENDGKAKYGGGRDVVGYAKSAPNPYWPKKAKV